MKRFLVPIVLLVLAACAQTPTPGEGALPDLAPLTFGSSNNDSANALAKHSSGVYAVGYTSGNLHGTQKGNGDAFVRKYDTSGSVLWGRQFGTPSYEIAEGVASDSSNNAYVLGTTFGSLAGSRGNNDVFLRKYTSSGGVSWTRQIGTSSYEYAGDVAVYGSVVYVVGYTFGSLAGSKGSWDAFIRKYSSGGSVVWTRQHHYSDQDTGTAIAVSGSTVYLVGGFWYNNNSEDPDVRVVKYTTGGTKVWDVGYGPSGYDYVYDASVDSTGNLYFAGTTYTDFAETHQGGGDGYVIKLNSSGGYAWRKQLGTPEYDVTYAVLSRTDSQVYAAGETYGVLGSTNSGNSDAYLRRLSGSSGSTVWTDQ